MSCYARLVVDIATRLIDSQAALTHQVCSLQLAFDSTNKLRFTLPARTVYLKIKLN